MEMLKAALVERDGRLVRRLAVLNVDVLADRDGRRLRLAEDRQQFPDGRVRRRDLPCSLAEKVHAGEDHATALARALAKELGILRARIIGEFEDSMRMIDSPSFPGLLTEYAVTRVAVLIDPAEFRAEYREDQPDKSTFFLWHDDDA